MFTTWKWCWSGENNHRYNNSNIHSSNIIPNFFEWHDMRTIRIDVVNACDACVHAMKWIIIIRFYRTVASIVCSFFSIMSTSCCCVCFGYDLYIWHDWCIDERMNVNRWYDAECASVRHNVSCVSVRRPLIVEERSWCVEESTQSVTRVAPCKRSIACHTIWKWKHVNIEQHITWHAPDTTCTSHSMNIRFYGIT